MKKQDTETPETESWVNDAAATASLFGDAEEAASRKSVLVAREKDTYERQDRFLAAWVSSGDRRVGLQVAEVGIRTLERWKHDDLHGFIDRFEAAHQILCAEIDAKFVYLWRGLQPGQNALVLITSANAEMPDKYRPNVQPTDDAAKQTISQLMELAKKGRKKEPEAAEADFLATLRPPQDAE